MNKQPFYHRAELEFAAAGKVKHETISAALKKGFKRANNVLKYSIEVEEMENLPEQKYSAVVLFTATRDLEMQEFQAAFEQGFAKSSGLVAGSVKVVGMDAEPGDPYDLM